MKPRNTGSGGTTNGKSTLAPNDAVAVSDSSDTSCRQPGQPSHPRSNGSGYGGDYVLTPPVLEAQTNELYTGCLNLDP